MIGLALQCDFVELHGTLWIAFLRQDGQVERGRAVHRIIFHSIERDEFQVTGVGVPLTVTPQTNTH